MAVMTHATTTTGAVTGVLVPGMSAFRRMIATNGLNTAPYYVKFWWSGTGTNYSGQGNTVPTIGTTRPQLTIEVPVGGVNAGSEVPLNNGGPVYYWISNAPGDLDTTVLTAGGDVVTIAFE